MLMKKSYSFNIKLFKRCPVVTDKAISYTLADFNLKLLK